MKKRILFCATVDYHFHAFHLPYMKWFKEQGWEVHVAASGNMMLPYTDKKFDIPIHRSPIRFQNVEALLQLKAIINDNDYSIVHCHTPIGGVLTRLAARKKRKDGVKVIYTAHGFHFCKGTPTLNWVIYYPIEKLLSRLTDCLITINQEDFNLAREKQFKAFQIEHVHGVGVDMNKYKPLDTDKKIEKREMLGYRKDDILLFYGAEFNNNKNQQLLIKALSKIKEDTPNIKLLLAGDGPLLNQCKELAEQLDVMRQVDFLGYRSDIEAFLPICDIGVGSSYREGLPVNIMEAMACGLPLIVTENRGHSELVKNKLNGYIIPLNDENLFAEKILELYNSEKQRMILGSNSLSLVKKYSLMNVKVELSEIYKRYMEEMEEFSWAIQ